MLCFVLKRTPINENNSGTERRGIQQLLRYFARIVWLPLLSACNLQKLAPLFLCQFFSLDIARGPKPCGGKKLINRKGVIILLVIVSSATFSWPMTPISCISIFCLHSTQPNPFVGLKHSRTEKSPWMKSKTRPGPKRTTAKTYAPGT